MQKAGWVQDEIGTEAEALAARSIAQRGVQLVATAHGAELARLIKNPTLSDLIGGIQACASPHLPSPLYIVNSQAPIYTCCRLLRHHLHHTRSFQKVCASSFYGTFILP